MNFDEFKTEVLTRAKKAGACTTQYKRACEATTFEELAEIIKDNIGFNRNNSIVTAELANSSDRPEIWNLGKENTGLFNSGYLNSGDLNSGDLNSGYRNSGYRNSGDRNSGDRNSGDRNSGDLNSGDRNSGDLNSGDLNSGDLNSGDRNSGDRNSGYQNSGDRNSGDRNSGDLNSGYRNSGVFCTRKRTDTVLLFNKESRMTWDEWFNNPAYDAACGLNITIWINWNELTDDEKKDNPKAYVCGGYLKVFSYHEAWANLWKTLSNKEKDSFKMLPNFDPEIFEEITGINIG